MNYNELHSHPRDSHITFDAESHEYLADGIACDSVTTIISALFPQFDAPYWAARKAPAEGCTPQELMDRWEAKARQARDLGTELHDRIERHYLGEEPSEAALADTAFRYFLRFAQSHPLTPYRSEWRIFSTRYRVAGTLDFLAVEDGKLVIYDWKRSAKLIDRAGNVITENRYGEHALHPRLTHIPDTSYDHYALQVSLYRYLLEEEYGMEIAGCFLGTFHPGNPCEYVIPMPYRRREIEIILAEREQQ